METGTGKTYCYIYMNLLEGLRTAAAKPGTRVISIDP
jgi:restriction endonuclease